MVSDSFINIFFASVARFLVLRYISGAMNESLIFHNIKISLICILACITIDQQSTFLSLSLSLSLSFSHSQKFCKQQLPTLGKEGKERETVSFISEACTVVNNLHKIALVSLKLTIERERERARGRKRKSEIVQGL